MLMEAKYFTASRIYVNLNKNAKKEWKSTSFFGELINNIRNVNIYLTF